MIFRIFSLMLTSIFRTLKMLMPPRADLTGMAVTCQELKPVKVSLGMSNLTLRELGVI
jgi:hypothetical protein